MQEELNPSFENTRKTSIVPRAKSISQERSEARYVRCSTATQELSIIWESICLLLCIKILRLITGISLLAFISGIHWDMKICIIMRPCMIFRKACKSCMKYLNLVYAKLWNRKVKEAKLRVLVPLLQGCKTDKV